jgi:hypothetical protein
MTQIHTSWMFSRYGTATRAQQTALLIMCIAISLAFPRAMAQAIFGSINGTITDPSGAVVPNASITITDTDKGTTRVVTGSDSGAYLVHDLIPDHYQLKIEAPGFASVQSEVISVSADSSAQVNFELKPGSASQTVEVTAEAPGVEDRSRGRIHHAQYAYGGRDAQSHTKYHRPCVAGSCHYRFHFL